MLIVRYLRNLPRCRPGCWLRSLPGEMSDSSLRVCLGPQLSGPGIPSSIFYPTSSTPDNIQGIGLSLQIVRTRCGRARSQWTARSLPLQSCSARSVSWWDLQVPHPHFTGRGSACHYLKSPFRRCGRNPSRGSGRAPESSWWLKLCTHFSASTGRVHRKWRPAGSLGRCWPPYTHFTGASTPCVIGGGASPTRFLPMLGWFPLFPGRAGGRRGCWRYERIYLA